MKIQEITKSFPYCDLLKNTFFLLKMQQITVLSILIFTQKLLKWRCNKLQYHFHIAIYYKMKTSNYNIISLLLLTLKKKNPMKMQQTTISFPSCYLLTKRFFMILCTDNAKSQLDELG